MSLEEQTIGIIKPHFFQQSVDIIDMIFESGLDVPFVAIIQKVDRSVLDMQYAYTSDEFRGYGENQLKTCEKEHLHPYAYLASTDPFLIGREVIERHKDYMMSGGLVAIFIEGVNAKARLKTLAGKTEPISAVPGTIRYEFSGKYGDHPAVINSYLKALTSKSTLHNVIHIPDPELAQRDLDIWRDNEDKMLVIATMKPEELPLYLNTKR